MKKLFLLTVAIAASVTAFSQARKLANPRDENGRYIVKWDCENDDWATSNDFEIGETFTFAVDLTDSGWDVTMANAPEGATRSIAAHLWFHTENVETIEINPEYERLVRIKDNIYGVTYNLAEVIGAKSADNKAEVLTNGVVTYAYVMLHHYAYGMKDGKMEPGVEWWIDATRVDDTEGGCLFATLPSTGKLDPSFKTTDYTPGIFTFDLTGYATPCAGTSTDVEDVEVAKTAEKVIMDGQIILIHNGVRYNVLGAVVK